MQIIVAFVLGIPHDVTYSVWLTDRDFDRAPGAESYRDDLSIRRGERVGLRNFEVPQIWPRDVHGELHLHYPPPRTRLNRVNVNSVNSRPFNIPCIIASSFAAHPIGPMSP